MTTFLARIAVLLVLVTVAYIVMTWASFRMLGHPE